MEALNTCTHFLKNVLVFTFFIVLLSDHFVLCVNRHNNVNNQNNTKLKLEIIRSNKEKELINANSRIKSTSKLPSGIHPLNHHRYTAESGSFRHVMSEARRVRREVASGSRRTPLVGDTAVYFSAKEVLRLRVRGPRTNGMVIPKDNFTVEFWTKPNGGQQNPVSILSLTDICTGRSTSSGWKMGIRTTSTLESPKSKFFLEFRGEQTMFTSTLSAIEQYIPDKWYHIVITYGSEIVKLFINGALVGVNFEQSGPLFGDINQKCKEIHIGGDQASQTFFRGTIDDLRIWNDTLNQEEIVSLLNGDFTDLNENSLILDEDFESLRKWRKVSRLAPEIIFHGSESTTHDIKLKPPLCGETVCDDPDVIRNYAENDQMREMKRIRYRIVNIMNDDGSNPIVTPEQVRRQHAALVETFSLYNITWILQQHNIRNTTLRQKVVLINCNPENIGDNVCNLGCSSSRTGNDGGDCEHINTQCNRSLIGNGVCNGECNKVFFNWDGGDCCLPGPDSHMSCFDPASPERGYMGLDEYKTAINLNGASKLNIMFLTYPTLIGLATMPWDRNVYSTKGGVMVHPGRFGAEGKTKNLVHELGHVLGLWHVHHGVTEMECSNACLETHPSLVLGDLCEDTNPTPNNTECRNADWTRQYCGITAQDSTPFSNYMGYAGDDCINHFTPQQTARMHCYMDLVYQPLSPSKKPSPVPLPPKIIGLTNSSVTLTWLPPFGSKMSRVSSVCDLCDYTDAMHQFVSSGVAFNRGLMGMEFSASQVEGHPDASPCEMHERTWMPDRMDCSNRTCFIDLEFDFFIIPTRLTVWITSGATDSIEDVVLYFTSGGEESYGSFTADCDMPLTIDIRVINHVNRVRLYVTNPYVGIDAAKLSTNKDYIGCLECRHKEFKITRSPEFIGEPTRLTRIPIFVDQEVELAENYTYSVSVVHNGRRESVLSTPLHYTHGQHYCGDAITDSELGEECDDGNLLDGDGCSVSCVMEEGFNCRGRPSTCFQHDGDGVCEEFEEQTSVRDCGHFTPDGFEDQWASSARANPEHVGTACPESKIVGPPRELSVCNKHVDSEKAWYPCGSNSVNNNFWIETYFAKPVVLTTIFLHLDSDGKQSPDDPDNSIRVEVLGSINATQPIAMYTQWINCDVNPVVFHIRTDWRENLRLVVGIRIRFSFQNISFTGVRIRSPKNWDPHQLSACRDHELYNHNSRMCVARVSTTSCHMLPIQNGRSVCTGYREGDVCRVSCDSGYTVSTPLNELMCLNGSWHSIGRVGCVPVKCPRPTLPFASVVCFNGTSYGSVCRFKCHHPAQITGRNPSIECDADGKWSVPTASCQIQCQSPSLLVNNARLTTQKCMRGLQPVGQKCKFQCFKGYHEEERGPIRKNIQIQCETSGIWSESRCVRTRCPRINPVFSGLYSCTRSLFAGSTCTLRCPGGESVQTSTCNYIGEWTNDFTFCGDGLSGNCPSLPIDTGGLLFDCTNNYIGYQCRVSCMFPNQSPMITSQTNGVRGQIVESTTLSGDSPVHQLTCTALSVWQPDPRSLTCIHTCNEASMNDGWCDGANNRAFCEWDGGDCCKSTSISGDIIPFPTSCTVQCTCKDPSADENRNANKKRRVNKKRRHS